MCIITGESRETEKYSRDQIQKEISNIQKRQKDDK